jgi:sugar O-acyltransferase (sialic acid O-acetyltransferase NeuD family)
MKDIAIFGAGGFGREVKMLLNQINAIESSWNFIGFFDDGTEKEKIINGSPVLGGIKELNNWQNPLAVVFAIGNPIIKKNIIKQVTNKSIFYPILIHPNSIIGEMQYNSIGEGSIITAGNILTINISIGCHVILNLSCTVGHDTIIGDYASFMPSVNISGEVNIAECVYVGTGVKIINQIEIGENTIIGAGAVVAKSLPSNCTAVGIPAKPVKYNK